MQRITTFARKARARSGECPACLYPVAGDRCSECGVGLDAATLATAAHVRGLIVPAILPLPIPPALWLAGVVFWESGFGLPTGAGGVLLLLGQCFGFVCVIPIAWLFAVSERRPPRWSTFVACVVLAGALNAVLAILVSFLIATMRG